MMDVMKALLKVLDALWLFMVFASCVIVYVAIKDLDSRTNIGTVIIALVLVNVLYRIQLYALAKAIDEETTNVHNASVALDVLNSLIKSGKNDTPHGPVVDTIIVNDK